MKPELILKCLFSVIFGLLVTALEHEKSFLMQESASAVWSIATYEDSLLLTTSNDIVQKDIHTGAIQRTFRAHKKPIFSFAVTEDSRMITSAYDDMIIVWDLLTSSIIKRIWLRSSDTLVRSIYFQDSQVFTGGLDKKVRQVDLASGRITKTISIGREVYCVVAAEDSIFVGKEIFPYGLKLSVESGAISLSLTGHSGSIFSLFLYESFLFSGSSDSTVIQWNALTGERTKAYEGHLGTVNSVAVFDGELYSATSFKELFKWNISEGFITRKFSVVATGEMLSMTFKSRTLFTGSSDTTAIGWDAVSGDILLLYLGRNTKIRSVVSWKNFIISGGEDAEIRMWDVSVDSIDPFIVLNNSHLLITTLNLFENYLYSGDYYGNIKMVSLTNLTLIMYFTTVDESINSLAANKLSLYGGGDSGSIHLWNISSGVRRASFSAHLGPISSLQLSEDILYSGSFEATLKSWNTKTLVMILLYNTFHQINAILVRLEYILACNQRSIESFYLISGETYALVDETSAFLCIASREDVVYTGHEDSLVRVRSLYSLISVESYAGHLDAVTGLCLDDRFILYSAGNDGAVKKWNIATRSVAFSFEMKNASVYSLAVNQNQLFVGLKSGRIDCYNIENTMSLKSIGHHSKTVTSLIASNGSIFSSSLDGTILKISSKGDGNFFTVHKSKSEPLKSLAVRSSFWVALQGDTKIVFGRTSVSSELITSIDFQTPLRCLALTESIILAGSKSGIIYGWGIQSLQPVFALKGHVSPVNNLFAVDDRLFSASDDKTIIEWSLESQTASKTYKRLSASALGHLGPVNSLSYCYDTLFSAGSDLTVRRWNTKSGKHDDVYFGFTKSVTAVLCYNGSVFAGSEDFSVLMFKPSLPQSKDATVNPSGTVLKRSTKRGKVVRLQRAEGSSINVTQIAVSVTAVVVVITTLIFGCLCYKKRVKKNVFQTELAVTTLDNLTAQTAFDLATVVNSVMGISKHAAYLMENSVLAKIKRLTAGGGGEVFLAKIMDASLSNKIGEVVIQKVVFTKNKDMEEAFYQEVGIMILLNSFPHFCTILGYTEKPLSIVLKYYPEGSLYEWIRKTDTTKRLALKIVKELSEALNVMHSHFLAHCDIKPQNILVQVENGIASCFLTDFGITQVLSERIVATKTFHVINLRGLSIPYAAPEALKNFRSKSYTRADFRKYDIYSLACVFYELLLQKGPWDYCLMENN